MAAGGGQALHMENIFQLLESSETVKDIKEIILDNLQTNNESWLIQLLVDRYFQTQSTNIQEILAEIRESQAKTLLEKLQEGIKTPDTRLASLQLTCYLVYRELPWCHLLVESNIFSSILKCLRTEQDVPILMTALMILVMILPSVPVAIGQYLQNIFEIFEILANFCVKKPANTPEIFVLHLQVALYSLFHRLYGMYPCSFTSFISRVFARKENVHAFHEVVQPMLDRVRLHPKLITGQKEMETAANRWKNLETQDIVVACSKLSLDLIEGSWEDSQCPVFNSIKFKDKDRILDHASRKSLSSSLSEPRDQNVDTASHLLYVPSYDVATLGESPSVLIGLSTPPTSQRTTPATSFLNSGTLGETPENASRQHTPSHPVDEGEKHAGTRGIQDGKFSDDKITIPNTSKTSSGSMLAQPKHQKSQSQHQSSSPVIASTQTGLHTSLQPGPLPSLQPDVLNVPPVTTPPHTTPTTPGAHLCTSPAITPGKSESLAFKSNSSAFASPSRTSAMRSLNFSSDKLQVTPNSPPKTHQSSQENDATNRMAAVSIESLPKLISTLDTHQAVNVDQEVEDINEGDDQFQDGSPASCSSNLPGYQGTEMTAESVRQFMKKVNRIRFNSLTSNSSSDIDTISLNSQGSTQQRGQRARSCPPLKRQLQPQTPENTKEGRRGKKASAVFSAGGRSQGSNGKFMRQKSAVDAPRSHDRIQPPLDLQSGQCAEISEDSFDDVANVAVSTTVTPHRGAPRTDSNDLEDEIVPALPASVKPVFQYLLAPSKLSVCSRCQSQLMIAPGQHDAITTIKANEVAMFSSISPPEVLDRHLRLGSDLHTKQLTKIPLTSKDSTNWTHFGGMPPADEVNILRGQILLMQNQLMYERQQRSHHAKRNRRLLRRIAHVAALEEQTKTLGEQVGLKEQEVQQLKVSIKILQSEHRTLAQVSESDEYGKLVEFKTSLKENKDLKAEKVVLKNLMLNQKDEYDRQQQKLENLQHKHLEMEKQVQFWKDQVDGARRLQDQVFQLQKEVLLMQELHQKCQLKLSHHGSSAVMKGESSYIITALKTDQAELMKENKKRASLLEAYQTRNAELEEQIKAKDAAMVEMRKSFSSSKLKHEAQLSAVEDRCLSQVKIIQQMECHLMKLTGQLKQNENLEERLLSRLNMPAPTLTSDTSHDERNSSTLAHKAKMSPIGEQGDSVNSLETQKRSSKKPQEALIVMASDAVSVESSNFSDKPSSGHLTSISTHGDDNTTDLDVLSDSGTASQDTNLFRTSDSFAILHSDSFQSINTVNTADSGCWPKTE